MSDWYPCPCVTEERPLCGAECWHHVGGFSTDCAFCHRTGRVSREMLKRARRLHQSTRGDREGGVS